MCRYAYAYVVCVNQAQPESALKLRTLETYITKLHEAEENKNESKFQTETGETTVRDTARFTSEIALLGPYIHGTKPRKTVGCYLSTIAVNVVFLEN